MLPFYFLTIECHDSDNLKQLQENIAEPKLSQHFSTCMHTLLNSLLPIPICDRVDQLAEYIGLEATYTHRSHVLLIIFSIQGSNDIWNGVSLSTF